MNIENTSSIDEDFMPRNQIPQWGNSTPLKSPNPRIFVQSPLHDQFHGYYSNSQTRSKQNTTSAPLDPQAVFTSFDIYGNELNMKEENTNEWEDRPSDIDRTRDGWFKEQIKSDKENSNPALSIITPLKKRNENRNSSAKGSFGNNRSPLLDITPCLSVKKTVVPQEFKIEFYMLMKKFHNSSSKFFSLKKFF